MTNLSLSSVITEHIKEFAYNKYVDVQILYHNHNHPYKKYRDIPQIKHLFVPFELVSNLISLKNQYDCSTINIIFHTEIDNNEEKYDQPSIQIFNLYAHHYDYIYNQEHPCVKEIKDIIFENDFFLLTKFRGTWWGEIPRRNRVYENPIGKTIVDHIMLNIDWTKNI